MSGETDEEEKTYAPTPKKLEDARRRGDVPRSVDVNASASYAGFCLAAVSVGSVALINFGDVLSAILANADTLSDSIFEGTIASAFRSYAFALLQAISPWIIIPFFATILAILAQRSLIFASDKLIPKISRISPIQNAKNKYGANGVFEFAKSSLKLVIYSVLLAVYLKGELPTLLLTPSLGALQVVVLLFKLALNFLFIVVVVSLIIGAIDVIWQYLEHNKRNLMSFNEVRDEAKEQEGDGSLKQARRQRGYDLTNNRMLLDVPKADVVIVNPQHYAVALQWSRLAKSAPVCVAKGVDEVAAKIRKIATEAGIPIQQDPPTARWLFSDVEVGMEIFPEHYEAVAAAIRFSETVRSKGKRVLS